MKTWVNQHQEQIEKDKKNLVSLRKTLRDAQHKYNALVETDEKPDSCRSEEELSERKNLQNALWQAQRNVEGVEHRLNVRYPTATSWETNKGRISFWFVFWALDLTYQLIRNPIQWIGDLFTWMFRGIFKRISAWIVGDLFSSPETETEKVENV